MAKHDVSKPTYYLDSGVLIDLIEHPETEDPAKTIVALMSAAENGDVNLITSTITIVEVIYAKKELDGKELDAQVTQKINNLWHPEGSPIRLVEVHELIVREAKDLLRDNIARGWAKTKGIDAVHLITARREQITEFFSNDGAMQKWGEALGFKVCSPHCNFDPEKREGTHPA